MTFIADHLWQSTLFAAGVRLLALAVRHNRASLRCWLWFTASVKFLFPFAVLVAVGDQVAGRIAPAFAQPEVTRLADSIGQPFAPTEVLLVRSQMSAPMTGNSYLGMMLLIIWCAGCVVISFRWWVRWRRVAAVVRQAEPVTQGREWDSLRRTEKRTGIKNSVRLVSSNVPVEPGIFGILKPVMLWPRHMTGHLSETQIESIMAHEICHIRRHDNLLAAIYMVVASVFWFHPLIWWLGSRLIDERERACDDEAIRFGSKPNVYAQSLLKTCELCVVSPLVCVAGVTGADLKERIVAIMRNRTGEELNTWRTLLLATAGFVVVTGPLVLGGLQGRPVSAQLPTDPDGSAFEVASVKLNNSGAPRMEGIFFQPGGRFLAENASLRELIQYAYAGVVPLQSYQISGGPEWVDTYRFDIAAKASANIVPGPGGRPPEEAFVMVRKLLAERFKLAVHSESREGPIYALVVARSDGKLGPRLRRSEIDCSTTPKDSKNRCGLSYGTGRLTGRGIGLVRLAGSLASLSGVGRLVEDRTGLTGSFDMDMEWTPDLSAEVYGPSLFTALEEELGLKLESRRGVIDFIVIDHADKPTPD